MCSLAECDLPSESDDNISECSVDTSSSSLDPTLCKKCRAAEAEVTLRLKDRYCRQCFTVATVHKFRATLAKHRVMRHDESVLLHFDGGQNSVAMMKFVNSSLDEKNVKVSAKAVLVSEPNGHTKASRKYHYSGDQLSAVGSF